MGDPFRAMKKISEKMKNLNSLTVPKKMESLIVSKKVERGTLLLWNGFVRGFGCAENEVLSAYMVKVHNAQKVDRSR